MWELYFFMDQCCESDPHTGSYFKKPLTKEMKSALHTLLSFLYTASAFIQVGIVLCTSDCISIHPLLPVSPFSPLPGFFSPLSPL